MKAPTRRRLAALLVAIATLVGGLTAYSLRAPATLIEGIIWQPTNDYSTPRGHWHWLGVDTLVVQWSVNDGLAWVPTDAFDAQPMLPDWQTLRQQPWAGRLILGLASRMHLEDARREWATLRHQGRRLHASLPVDFTVDGWYAPIEFSPDWAGSGAYSPKASPYLDSLPAPRYVSAYGGYDMSPDAFAAWVESWLPADATLLFQDGVGAAGQTPAQARARADALAEALGEERLIMVLEAFQPDGASGFRSASLGQLISQLRTYRGLRIHVFSARHLPTRQVIALRLLAPALH